MHQRLGSIASQQHGVFTRRQAMEVGFSRAAIDDRIHRGIWVVADYGVYRAAETPTGWHQRLMAACLAGPAVASHRSAAALWNFPDFGTDLVEVTALRHRRRKSTDVIWHESVILDYRQITEIDRIPVTTATRTVLDVAAVVDATTLLVTFDDAERRHLSSRARTTEELERFGNRRPGSAAVRKMLQRRPIYEPVRASKSESLFDVLVEEHEVPKPTAQFTIRDAEQRFVACVDFAFVGDRLAIELDGARFHGGAGSWEHDLDRQNAIEALDWRVLRFPYSKLEARPADVARVILKALDHGRASLTPE
jgi:hypothetical protein